MVEPHMEQSESIDIRLRRFGRRLGGAADEQDEACRGQATLEESSAIVAAMGLHGAPGRTALPFGEPGLNLHPILAAHKLGIA